MLIAIAGYLFTYFHKKNTDERNAALNRVNLQLRELYGPLYAELLSRQAAWDAFYENYWPSHGKEQFFSEEASPSAEEVEKWITWRTEVFHPKNERIEEIIKNNVDLLDEDGFPDAFTRFMAHVSGYKAVLGQWKNEDYSEFTSVCNFPYDELFRLVESQYYHLRAKQKYLISGLKQDAQLSPGEKQRLIDFLEEESHNHPLNQDTPR